MTSRKQRSAGGLKFNLVLALGVLGLVAVAILLLTQQRSPEAAANEFMQALAKKDVVALTDLSYLEDAEPPLREQWDFCVNRGARNYVFMWQWLGSQPVADDRHVMKLVILEFNGPAGKEGDVIELPLIDRDGWRVDLESVSRNFFPYLPQ